MNKPQQAPTVYRGHVVSVTLLEKKKLVKVMVDDVGTYYRQTFWIDHDNTPEWLGPRMEVLFWLIPIGIPDGSKKNRKRIAINVIPAE